MTKDNRFKDAEKYMQDLATSIDEEGLDREGNARFYFLAAKALRICDFLQNGEPTESMKECYMEAPSNEDLDNEIIIFSKICEYDAGNNKTIIMLYGSGNLKKSIKKMFEEFGNGN